jgi:hypothetical protein
MRRPSARSPDRPRHVLCDLPRQLEAVYAGLADELVRQHVVEYRSKAPFGASVTVSVHLPSGDTTTGFLAPGVANLPATRGGEAVPSSILTGPIGMALVAALTFLATLGVLLLAGRAGDRRRRERLLGTRLPAAQPEWQAQSGQVPTQAQDQTSTWIPDEIASVAERALGAKRGRRLAHRLEQLVGRCGR